MVRGIGQRVSGCGVKSLMSTPFGMTVIFSRGMPRLAMKARVTADGQMIASASRSVAISCSLILDSAVLPLSAGIMIFELDARQAN